MVCDEKPAAGGCRPNVGQSHGTGCPGPLDQARRKVGSFADALPAAFYGATIVTARGSKSTTVATALGVNNYPASFKWKFLFQVRTPPGGSQKPTEGELLAGAVYHVHIELPKQKGYSDEDLEKKTEGLDVSAEMEGKPYIAGKGA